MGWKRKRLDAMGDEDLHDIRLVGTDGEEVPCNKGALAMSSPVFKGMFFRGFKEQDRCSLDFRSVVISAIVKFCYCGEGDMDLIIAKNRPLDEEASLLIELREAGRYFELEDLFSTVESTIGNLVFQKNGDKKYQYASALLTELYRRGEDTREPLFHSLSVFVRHNLMRCFFPRAIEDDGTDACLVHPGVLSKVLKKTKDTYEVVLCLQTWFSHESKSVASGYTDEEKKDLIKIAEDVELKLLSTKQLSNIKPCSLFSSERILEAFVHHCKDAKNENKTPRTKMLVSGAGMKHLNGYYRELMYYGERVNVFSRPLVHNGNSCCAIIHRKHPEKRWLLSISKTTAIEWPGYTEKMIHEGCIAMHVYESCELSDTEDPKVPPFNRWKCIGGTGETPVVACINYESSNRTGGD